MLIVDITVGDDLTMDEELPEVSVNDSSIDTSLLSEDEM